jgi:phosphopantetheinyl transferase (holo-ACP synthase)
MKLSSRNFIIDDSVLFSTEHIKDALDYPHVMSLVLLDLESLAMETQKAGEKIMVGKCLSPKEQQQFAAFSYRKRKNEWLGGRIGAKIAAARCMAAYDIGEYTAVAWQNIAIKSQESGRPYLALNKQGRKPLNISDISISHSTHLATAMAVSTGKCGIDIQQASQKTVKVKKRFCTLDEFDILQGFLPDVSETVMLTMLWAAKEALRKAADTTPVPGFLELHLMELYTGHQGLWSLIFNCPEPLANGLRVAVSPIDDYILAVTVRSDTVA